MNRRFAAVFFFMCMAASFLIMRLSDLALEESYVEAAESQSTYRITIAKTRGAIYDRSFRPLAGRMTDFRALVMPQRDTIARLTPLMEREEILACEQKLKGRMPFVMDVSDGRTAGRDVVVFKTEKRYSESPLAVHLVGYVDGGGQGASGIERAYDGFLSEHSGELTASVRVNAAGRAMTYFEPEVTDTTKNSMAGVVTNIDADIQLAAERAMGGKTGAALVMSVDGEILAGVSSPSYSQQNVSASLSEPNSPLYNRLLASYDIGSVFKLVTAASALENGVSPDFSYECTGSVTIGSNVFHCSNRDGHGVLGMEEATACSCNTYFIALAQETGAEKLLVTAEKFGFGKAFGIADGMFCEPGSLPREDTLRYPSALANISFGQGSLMATPIHIACMTAAIANGGVFRQPMLVRGLTLDGQNVTLCTDVPEGRRIISEQTAQMLQKFMRSSVLNGTGRGGGSDRVECAAKTGTAQTGMTVDGKSVLQAWYAGFFPYEDPQYVCVVVVENGSSGSSDAGPVFRQIAESIY